MYVHVYVYKKTVDNTYCSYTIVKLWQATYMTQYNFYIINKVSSLKQSPVNLLVVTLWY